MALFVARNRARMMALYESRAAGRWPFCWPGLLAPQAWFLYRKMYLWAALVSAGPLLIAYVPKLAILSWSASLVGALGLRLYFDGAREDDRRHPRDPADEAEARALIARAGGVSRIGAVIGLAFGFSTFVLSLKAGAPGFFATMTLASLLTWATAPASAALLGLFLWRGRLPGRLFVDALAIGVTLGAAVAAALAPFDLKDNPLHFSPLTLAFLFAGLPEEGVKMLGVAAFLRRITSPRDRRDVVFAAGALSLGFAALENVFYLANAGAGWATLAVERAVTAMPFHVFRASPAALRSPRRADPLRLFARIRRLGDARRHSRGLRFFRLRWSAGRNPAARSAASVRSAPFDPAVALRVLLAAAEAAAAICAGLALAALGKAGRSQGAARFAFEPRSSLALGGMGARGAGWPLPP